MKATPTVTIAALALACAACAGEMGRAGIAAGDVAIAPEPSGVSLGTRSLTPMESRSLAPIPATVAYRDPTLDVEQRVNMLDAYVAAVDARVAEWATNGGSNQYTRTESTLSSGVFDDLTDDEWYEMIAYTDAGDLQCLTMTQTNGGKHTKAFYYDRGKLVAVRDDPDGVSIGDAPPQSGVQMFYFGNEGMLAWVRENGTRVDPSTAAFTKQSIQLRKEAIRFPLGR
jgi:hypothetical protein